MDNTTTVQIPLHSLKTALRYILRAVDQLAVVELPTFAQIAVRERAMTHLEDILMDIEAIESYLRRRTIEEGDL